MPAPHRLALLHALGGEHAQEAARLLRECLARHATVAAAAAELDVHEKTVHRWLREWGLRET